MKELVSFLPHIFMIFIGNIFYCLCFQKLNKTKFKINFKNILILIFASIIVCITNLFAKIEIKSLIVFIIMCINFKLLFNLNMKKTAISYLIIFLILMILEIIITNILSITGLLNSSEDANYLTIVKMLLSIIVSAFEYIIFSIKPINKLLKKLLRVLENFTSILNFSFLMYLAILTIGILNINKFSTDYSTQLIIILIIIFAFLFAIIIKSKAHEEILKNSNQKLIDYNERYSRFLDEYKIYKHNIKHKLAGIKTFGNKKINALIDDLLEEETHFTMKNNNLYNVPKGIKGIVAEKLYNVNISVIVDNKIVGDPFIKLSPKEFNSVSEAIGICLDNAVEASLETDNPIITFNLYEDNEYVYIKTGNNFCNRIDIDELGDKYYSTKSRGSGLGLFSIIQNKLIKEKISIINDFYYIELKIKKHAEE